MQLAAISSVDRRNSCQCVKFHILGSNRDYLRSFPTFAAKFKLIALDRKIRVGAVSYLNTKPLLYGIENSAVISGNFPDY